MNEDNMSFENEINEEETPAIEETDSQNIDNESQDDLVQDDLAQDEIPQDELAQEEQNAQGESLDSEEEVGPSEPAEIPYHERYYLKYREGKRTTDLDLSGTKEFLQNIGFDGGELRQARKGNIQSDGFENKKNQMYCSYCGSEISGVEYYRLPDGRLRCTACSRSIVTDKEEIQEICKRVITNFDSFFGATIDVPVSIEVLDERKLKKKIGAQLGTRDSNSILILGVAINKKKKYSILLENGAPRISLIATFAHELTHIWQYTHWDKNKNLKKCPKSNHLIVYEGMAKWVEIQYLYLIGETAVAKREEFITRGREDEYGVGFCLYEDRYPLSREAMVCEETPFTPDKYPL